MHWKLQVLSNAADDAKRSRPIWSIWWSICNQSSNVNLAIDSLIDLLCESMINLQLNDNDQSKRDEWVELDNIFEHLDDIQVDWLNQILFIR